MRGEHLDKSAHPYDLLNTHLAPGMRKLPSELDVQILQTILAEESPLNPPTLGDLDRVPPRLGERPPKGFSSSYNGGNLRNGLLHRVGVRRKGMREKGQGGQLNAALTSEPLLAIANGDFSISDTTTEP